MIFTQRDWSLGEGQRYFRSQDDESVRRFFDGRKLNVAVAGQAMIREDSTTITAAAAVTAMASSAEKVWYATSTNLYSVGSGGTATDHGAHTVGAAFPSDLVDDESGDVYAGGATSGAEIRKWDGSAFSTFVSNQRVDALTFLNNTLYTIDQNEFSAYDSSGTRSAKYQWKGADGGGVSTVNRLIQSGGQVAILRDRGEAGGPELYEYDGTGVALTAVFPLNFQSYDLGVFYGATFISGRYVRSKGGTAEYLPAILYYSSGTIGLLWAADDWTSSDVTVCCTQFNNLMVFNDPTRTVLLAYNLDTGGVSPFATYAGTNGTAPKIAASRYHVAFAASSGGTTIDLFPASVVATSATLTTSLFDADNSNKKHFHTVVVEYDEATDGDGGSVDIAYRLNDLASGGAFTSLQTGLTAGTEYAINQTAQAIAFKITLNKGTSTLGPVLKRVKARAAPILDGFRRATFVLDLTGRDGDGNIVLRDGTTHAKDGHAMAADLFTAAKATAPITVTDRFGTYKAVIDTDQSDLMMELHPEEYVAVVVVRAVEIV